MENYRKVSDAVDAAERSAKRRKIRKTIIILSVVVVVAAVFTVLWMQGPFESGALFKSRYPWNG